MIDHEALLQAFLAETAEGFSLTEEALLVLERQPENEEALATVFRQAHNLKGNAAFFGFANVVELAHVVEDLLERLRHRTLSISGELITLLLQAVDVLKVMIEPGTANASEEWQPEAQALLDQLARIAGGETSAEEPARAAPEAATQTPSEGARGLLQEQLPDSRPRTLRVHLDKLDRLLNLTGEIGVARGRLTQMLADPRVTREAILEAQEATELLYTELQELVMKLRMVQVGPIFQQYDRTLRDLARSHGKLARLETEGGEVEVDNRVIEHLKDPLTHMIRNALDHGIESPETRVARGKDPCGLVTLRAYHNGSTIVIELVDDGAGLDRERILDRARSLGIVPLTTRPSTQEIDQLIFASGFSTAESVTQLSGRGVGMDVVRRNIEALRGSVGVASRPGEGTTIALRLPLTLAVIQGLNVGVGEETYVIPIDCVTETLAFRAEEPAHRRGQGVINLRGRSLPYVRLRDLLRLDGAPPQRESLVVVHQQDGEAGLVVDALHGESQIVIKPLVSLLRGLPGLAGSAILGSGRVAFILDVPDLLSQIGRQMKTVTAG